MVLKKNTVKKHGKNPISKIRKEKNKIILTVSSKRNSEL
jgi:hypothetical protein